MKLDEFKRELRGLLRRVGVRGYRYAAVVVSGRPDGPDEVIVVQGRVRTPAPRPKAKERRVR